MAKAKDSPQRERRNPPTEQADEQASPIAGSHVFNGRHVHVLEDGSLAFREDEWFEKNNGISTAVAKPDRDGVLLLIGEREQWLNGMNHNLEYRDTALASLYAFRDLVQPVESGDQAEAE